MKFKKFDWKYWRNFSLSFYAGAASGIIILTWQELIKTKLSFCTRVLVLLVAGIISYFLLGFLGYFLYGAFKSPKKISKSTK